MEQKQYVVANIKIPMIIKENGDLEPLTDYMSILFENLTHLQKPTEIDYNNSYLKDQIKQLLLEKEIIEETPMITHDELKNKKKLSHKKNLSFKGKKSSPTRYTLKNLLQPMVTDKGAAPF